MPVTRNRGHSNGLIGPFKSALRRIEDHNTAVARSQAADFGTALQCSLYGVAFLSTLQSKIVKTHFVVSGGGAMIFAGIEAGEFYIIPQEWIRMGAAVCLEDVVRGEPPKNPSA